MDVLVFVRVVCVSCGDIWDCGSTCRRKENDASPPPLSEDFPAVTSVALAVFGNCLNSLSGCSTESFISLPTAGTKKLLHTGRDLSGGVLLLSASRGHCRTLFCRAQRTGSSQKYSMEPIGCSEREQKKRKKILLLCIYSTVHSSADKHLSAEFRQTLNFIVVCQFVGSLDKRPTLSLQRVQAQNSKKINTLLFVSRLSRASPLRLVRSASIRLNRAQY